jgi:hypothetical protein
MQESCHVHRKKQCLRFSKLKKERCLRIASLLGFSLKDITPAALKPVLWQTIASKYH